MSGPFDDSLGGETALHGLYVGVVVERDDPEQLGRVRVRIPGLLEPASAWARPLGGWGGSANRGVFAVPRVGAEVGVMFDRGDVDKPFYIGAHFGKPGGETEVPEQARRDQPDNVVLATETFRIELDEADGEERLRLLNVKTGDNVVMDAKRNSIMVAATTRLVLQAEGEIVVDAPVITIGGRALEQGVERPI